MRRSLIVCVVLALAGCGGGDDVVARPTGPSGTANRLTVGDAQTVIPADWRLAPSATQDALEERLGRLPSADSTGWEPRTPGPNATALVVSVLDPRALGAKGDYDPDDDEANVAGVIEGARDALREQKITGARFAVRTPTTLAGTKALVFDTTIPVASGGVLFMRTMVSSRDSRFYSLQAQGPASDGPKMRAVIESVRRAWTWR